MGFGSVTANKCNVMVYWMEKEIERQCLTLSGAEFFKERPQSLGVHLLIQFGPVCHRKSSAVQCVDHLILTACIRALSFRGAG